VLLFLVPADSRDVMTEYRILLDELGKYNPELLDKKRILAISKADLLDDELMGEMEKEIDVSPYVFISSVSGRGIDSLKDILWRSLNS
jgi:GTP-binding protein